MTFGEIVSTALINTLLGMGTVFAMLLLISFVISLFQFIPKEESTAAGKATEKATETMNQAEDEEDQAELVAVIMAAIMASQQNQKEGDELLMAGQTPADGQPWPYIVRSIKRRR
ncbi:MAG: OadG family protein [Firmicutes bacterium]|nr:OadG family protein [Bacillota bacterium]